MWQFMWRKRKFYGVIWRCFARVKCGRIMSGFRKWCDCLKSHLLCDLLRVLKDKSQVCGWAPVTGKLCAKHKNALWVFSVGDFVLKKPILCSKIVDFKSSVFGKNLAMGLVVWLTKKLYFPDVSNSFISSQNPVTFARKKLPSVASNKAVIVEP